MRVTTSDERSVGAPLNLVLLGRMITLTPAALRLIEVYRARMPQYEWCVEVIWCPGPADNWRSPEGEPVWFHGIPEGWVPNLRPYIPDLHRTIPMTIISGVKVLVHESAPPGFAFRGGAIDADADNLYIAR